MCYPDIVDRLDAESTGDGLPAEEVLTLARERFAAGRSMRGLPHVADLPMPGWWAVQRRPLLDGTPAVYLHWRWRRLGGRGKSLSLGRLDGQA